MKLLQQSYHCLVVLDERTAQDETVMVVQRIGDEIRTIRADFTSAQLLMTNLVIVNIDMAEAIRHAEATGGVYKLKYPSQTQQGGPTPRMRLGGG